MTWSSGAKPQEPTTAKGHGRKSRAAMAIAAAAAGLVLMEAPAATAEPAGISHDFLVYGADGNSYITGSVFFSNRSASVEATFHAAGCRRFYAYALAGTTQLDARSTSTHCNSTTGEDIPLKADVRGGANHVKVSLTDQNGQNARTGHIYR
ncbi:hypothetical protein QRX60_27670 [Amycolatopsis mongoliensis]|uniref:Uncharacterized protein n=1 Tax=Amycolatopsis mongoliensis TaxID=715475 RepID=A0A9Y2JGY2_9PSEU|nr:hypothetical protein [Amycolatopsis sp. 4-36]WIX97862.1 hypothetical protein QRX60_27670 [Amycolatopsis sp. 4-36]